VNLFKEHLIYEQSTARGLLLLLSASRSLRLFLRVVGKYCDGSLRDIAH
jgi:hypothetical protein